MVDEYFDVPPDAIDAAISRRIDEICDQFEMDWKQGRNPSIERYLTVWDGESNVLLTELLYIEIELRQRAGWTPDVEEYLERFPQQADMVQAAIKNSETADLTQSAADTADFSLRDRELTIRCPRCHHQVEIPEDQALAENTCSVCQYVFGLATALAAKRGDALKAGRRKDEPTDLSGTVLGNYLLLEQIGIGGMGEVYKARHQRMERVVALKTIRRSIAENEKAKQRFQRETLASGKLMHPNIVTAFDADEENGVVFLVMEYVEGADLATIVRQNSPLPVPRALNYILQTARGLAYAHQQQIFHRDVKPGNLLVDANERVRILDLGLAHIDQTVGSSIASEADDSLTSDSQMLGTVDYMSPEQAFDPRSADSRADVYSLGCTLFFLLTGRPLYEGKTVLQKLLSHRDSPIPQLSASVPGVSCELDVIFAKMVAKNPDDRIPAMEEVVALLEEELRRSFANQSTSELPNTPGRGDAGPQYPAARTRIGEDDTSEKRTNLSPAATPMIGRIRERSEIATFIQNPDNWLMTLTGPGGIGKTRLVMSMASSLVNWFAGGCWFADLSAAKSPASISQAVAQALGVPLPNDASAEEAVAAILQYRRPLLLILDNFEQLVDYADPTVGLWHRAAPQIKFLVTSRSLLLLDGEFEYALQPLSFPQKGDAESSLETISEFESVELFRQRAASIQPNFTVNANNSKSIVQICNELEGIPLAIELAAARVRVLDPSQIAEKLSNKFLLLRSTTRDRTPRQQTLEGAIDWSFELLSDWEQDTFLQSSIFPGAFTVAVAEDVIDLSEFPDAPPVLDALQNLREKSLLQLVDTSTGARLSSFATLREYALRRQAGRQSLQHRELLRRFVKRIAHESRKWNVQPWNDSKQSLDSLELESANLFRAADAAMDLGLIDEAAATLLAVARVIVVRGPAERLVSRIERLLAFSPGPGLLNTAQLMLRLSECCQWIGQWQRACDLAEQALAVAKEADSNDVMALAAWQLGEMQRLLGHQDLAFKTFTDALVMYDTIEDRFGSAKTNAAIGLVLWIRGQFDDALQHYDAAEELAHQVESNAILARVLRNRGHVFWQRGDFQQALKCYQETERIARELKDPRTTHLALGNLANVVSDLGSYDEALRLYSEAERIARLIGDRRGVAVNVGNRGISLFRQGDFDKALECYRQAEQIHLQIGNRVGLASTLAGQGRVLLEQGECEQALARFKRAQGINQEIENQLGIAENRGYAGIALCHLGRVEEARQELGIAVETICKLDATKTEVYAEFQACFAQFNLDRKETRSIVDEVSHVDD